MKASNKFEKENQIKEIAFITSSRIQEFASIQTNKIIYKMKILHNAMIQGAGELDIQFAVWTNIEHWYH